jgi:hypothetical protein
MPTATNDDVHRLSASFWENLKNGNIEVTHAEGTRLWDIVPPLGTFLFELVEDGDEGKKIPLTWELPGTPKPTIDAWNTEELVHLEWCPEGSVCGAAIGDVRATMQDFRACAKP